MIIGIDQSLKDAVDRSASEFSLYGFSRITLNREQNADCKVRRGCLFINDGDTVVFDAKSCVPRDTLTCKYDDVFGWVLAKGKELIYVGSTLWKHPMNWDAQGRWFIDGTVKNKECKND